MTDLYGVGWHLREVGYTVNSPTTAALYRLEFGDHRERLFLKVLSSYRRWPMLDLLTDEFRTIALGTEQRLGGTPQVVITSTITPGIDGGAKQSKSLKNYIALTDTPLDKFGKIMSIPAAFIARFRRRAVPEVLVET